MSDKESKEVKREEKVPSIAKFYDAWHLRHHPDQNRKLPEDYANIESFVSPPYSYKVKAALVAYITYSLLSTPKKYQPGFLLMMAIVLLAWDTLRKLQTYRAALREQADPVYQQACAYLKDFDQYMPENEKNYLALLSQLKDKDVDVTDYEQQHKNLMDPLSHELPDNPVYYNIDENTRKMFFDEIVLLKYLAIKKDAEITVVCHPFLKNYRINDMRVVESDSRKEEIQQLLIGMQEKLDQVLEQGSSAVIPRLGRFEPLLD